MIAQPGLCSYRDYCAADQCLCFSYIDSTIILYFSTWSGPAWSPAQSLSSILISIQSLLNEKPYHNEPGFEQVRIIEVMIGFKFLKNEKSVVVCLQLLLKSCLITNFYCFVSLS